MLVAAAQSTEVQQAACACLHERPVGPLLDRFAAERADRPQLRAEPLAVYVRRSGGVPEVPQLRPVGRADRLAGKCAAADASGVSGAPVVLWDCDGGAAQTWTWSNGTLTQGGKCLDVTGQGTVDGTAVILWDCTGGANQQWAPQPDGSL
ncbi:ricin-type beta-trefoil lectin domain protein [Streptomyces sp. NPDC097704]|uniref:ricin-type beta-trefoil lectin domain protein n=1 Tax=Streptomyces sp. NPDC097704 TaxID=3157101 RepID=UPI00331BD628